MNRRQLEAQNEALRELLGNLQAVLNDSLAELDEEGEEAEEDGDQDEEEEGEGEDDDRKSRAKRR